MSTCPSCFTERSAAGGCFCEDAPKVPVTGQTVVLETTIERVDEELQELLLNEPMSEAEVIRTARSLLDEHGLTNIRLGWMNTVNKLGECQFFKAVGDVAPRAFQIRFSRKLFKHLSYDEQMQTITHEVAHALTPGHHHDWVWANQHRALGGNAERCSKLPDSVLAATNKWVGTCPNGHKSYRTQRSEKMFRVSCGSCSRRYNPEFHYEWKAQW